MLLDRYVLKEIIPPAIAGFIVFTFALLMGSVLELAQIFVAKGANAYEVFSLLGNLSLSFLPITIPMSLLMGILAGISRMSAEREILALRTLAIPSTRLLKPVILIGFLALALNLLTNMYITPIANYKAAKSIYEMAISRTEREIRDGEFFEGIPRLTLYVGKKGKGLWENLFIENFKNKSERFILAKKGRLVINRIKRTAYFLLEDGEIHVYNPEKPYIYSNTKFKKAIEHIERDLIFPKINIGERPREKTSSAILEELKTRKISVYRKRALLMEFHSRIALAASTFLFVILGLLLTVNIKKGGTGFGFAASIIIVVFYYIAYSGARSFVEQGKIPVWLGMWIPNLLSLIPIFMRLPSLKGSIKPSKIKKLKAKTGKKERVSFRTFPYIRIFSILDTYIFSNVAKIFLLILSALYFTSLLISLFELIDDLFENQRPFIALIKYLYYYSPQILYYILPLTVLATITVAISLFYRKGEITAIKSGGISLFRFSIPLIISALLVSGLSFGIQEKILPVSNRKAEQIKNYIRGRKPSTNYRISRRWVYTGGKIFHYLHYDEKLKKFYDVTVLIIDKEFFVKKIVHAREALYRRSKWILKSVWFRDFDGSESSGFKQADIMNFDIGEPPSFFTREFKPPDEMNISELKNYIREMEKDGFDTRRLKVELETKKSFPFAAFIMAFIAIPLGLIFGMRGITIGIGLSLALAGVYWSLLGVFKSLGYTLILPATLAAWAPNVIFFLVGLVIFTFIRT